MPRTVQYVALTDTVARYISHFDTVTVLSLSVLLSLQNTENETLSLQVEMPETARCRLQHVLIRGQMEYRLHESNFDTTRSERRDLSTF